MATHAKTIPVINLKYLNHFRHYELHTLIVKDHRNFAYILITGNLLYSYETLLNCTKFSIKSRDDDYGNIAIALRKEVYLGGKYTAE